MSHGKRNILIVFALIFLISAAMLGGIKQLATVKYFEGYPPGYYHFWRFEGVTEKEYIEGPARTIDATTFPVTSNVDELIEKTKIEVIATVTMELTNQMREKGYSVTILSVYPTARLEQRREMRQYRDYSEVTIYSKLHIDCEVKFKTDKPLANSPLPVWAVLIFTLILNKLPIIIIAVCTGLAIYYGVQIWAQSFAAYENWWTEEYYDEQGNLVKRVSGGQKGTDWESILGTMITYSIVAAIAIATVYFVQQYYLTKKGGGRRI